MCIRDRRIRGVGTFAIDAESQNPLIMVDGIEVNNLNDIDPNEVESLSILKDAGYERLHEKGYPQNR